MVNPFTRTEGRLLFLRCLAADALDDLTSSDKLKLGDKGLHVDRMLIQHVARDDSGLSLMRRKDATSFLKRFMSVISDAVIQVCYQKAAKRRQFENRVWSIILSVFQNDGIEKDDDSRQSLEKYAKIDEIRRFSNKTFDSSHDVHRAMIEAEEYWKPSKRGEYQYVSGIMGISYNFFLSTEAGAAYINFAYIKFLKFWTKKIIEIDMTEKEKPSLGLLLENGPETICVPRSERRVESR